MRKEINLLLHRKKKSPLLKLLRSYLRPISLGTLFVFIILTGATFIYSLNLASKREAQAEQVSLFGRVVDSQKETEEKYFLLFQRLSALEKIFSQRSDAFQIIKEIKALTLPGISIDSLTIEEAGKVTLELQAENSRIVEEFVNKILAKSEENKKFTKIKLLSASREEEPFYTLSFQFETAQRNALK